jgi:sugar phosphate isomerase/epimerase
MRRLHTRSAEAGITPGSLHVSGFGGEGGAGLTKDVCHKIRAIDAAAELGCSMVSASGAGRGSDGGREAIVTVLEEIMPYAEERGVQISLENHVDNNLENIDDYAWILDRIRSAALGICMDTGHFDAAGVKLDDVVDRFSRRINHIHLKENRGFGAKEFVPFGEGTTENIRIVERMLELGYEGYLVVEVSPEIGGSGDVAGLEGVRVPYEMFSGYEDGE